MSRPAFTHAELMAMADAVAQACENQDQEKVEVEGDDPAIMSALEKLTAYQAGEPQPGLPARP